MYIGLYLIIPFLNILWKNIKDKKHKQYFMFILSILFILPTLMNIFNFEDINWFLNASKINQQIIPNYWISGGGYIIFYYFIGCYLKEYKLKINLVSNIFLIPLFAIVFGIFNYYRNYKGIFDLGIYSGHYSFEVVIITILLANLILNLIDFKILNKYSKLISKVSSLTFGGYLVSFIFDTWYYPYLMRNTTILKEKLIYIIPIVLAISLSSIALSYLIDMVQRLLEYIYNRIAKTKKLI